MTTFYETQQQLHHAIYSNKHQHQTHTSRGCRTPRPYRRTFSEVNRPDYRTSLFENMRASTIPEVDFSLLVGFLGLGATDTAP